MTEENTEVDETRDLFHYIPQGEWEAVVLEANAEQVRRLADEVGGGASATPGDPLNVKPQYLDYNNTYGKTSTRYRTQLYVVHTAECPLQIGYAKSLTNWAARSGYPEVSWHRFIDPATVVRWIPLKYGAWHATWANPLSIGYEQSGYARYDRSTWLSNDGLRQIDLLAQQIVDDGIPESGLRWLTNAQVAAIKSGADKTTVGLCTHAQINPENRTDPGAGYPKDVLLEWIKFYWNEEHKAPEPVEEWCGKRYPPLEIDGAFGPRTTFYFQKWLGTPQDRIISGQPQYVKDMSGVRNLDNWQVGDGGSTAIRAHQIFLWRRGHYKDTWDGIAGPNYWRAMASWLHSEKTKDEGYVWVGDASVKDLQRFLNKKFWPCL